MRLVEVITSPGRESSLPYLQGISNYSSPADVEVKFGPPDFVSVMPDKTRRLANYSKYGVFFSYEKDRVITIGVFNPALGPVQYRFESLATQ